MDLMDLTDDESQLLRETILEKEVRLKEEYRLVGGDEIKDKIGREIQTLESIYIKLCQR